MKTLLEEFERLEKESQAKLNDCISSYLKDDDYTKCNKHVESLRFFNERYKDIKAINEIVKVAIERIKTTLVYNECKKDDEYGDYVSAFEWKKDGDFYQGGYLKGQLDAYKEIIESLFGGDNDESNKNI